MSDEFRRLLDDAPDAELRSVLESGLSDQPSPRAITQAARSLGIGAAGLVSARVAAAAASRAFRASPWTVLAKWGGAGFLLGGIALSPVVLKTHAKSQARLAQQSAAHASDVRASDHRAGDQRAQTNAPEPAPVTDGTVAPPATLAKNSAEKSAQPRGESAVALAPSEPKPVTPKFGANTAIWSAASRSTLHSAERLGSASAALNASSASSASSAPNANGAANSNSAPGAAKRADLLDGEIALLDSTRTALKQGDANAALTLLDRHARLSVRTLSAEALLLRVQALVLAGRSDEARALARAALGGKSALPYAARLRKLAGLVE